MAKGGTDFLTGFLSAFNESKNKKKEIDIAETDRKLKTKLFENQLEALDLEKNAAQSFAEKFSLPLTGYLIPLI